jgi:hypothetical protein
LRGKSKCPHCRTIFAEQPPSGTKELDLAYGAQEYFESFMSVKAEGPINKLDKKQRFFVSFWTFATSHDEAATKVLKRLSEVFATSVNLKVAACMHDFEIMPGQKSDISCGHVGAPAAIVPHNPYEK